MNKSDYDFIKRHVDRYNCGQHEMYNGFMHNADGLVEEFASWQNEFQDAIPIGICPENIHSVAGANYIAFVFEMPDGDRYYVHVPEYWIAEYEAFDDGPKAMEEARWKVRFGKSKEEHEAEIEAVSSIARKQLEEADPEDADDDDENEDDEDPGKPESEYEEVQLPEMEKPKLVSPVVKPAGGNKIRVSFTCDALNTLQVAYNYTAEYANDIGLMFGIRYIHESLQKISRRAAELNDPELNISMLKLHLYDVDDVSGMIEIEEMKRRKEQNDAK